MQHKIGFEKSFAYLTRKPNSGLSSKEVDSDGIPLAIEGSRGIKEETLKKFKVGFETEKFRDDHGNLVNYECIVFPMFALQSKEEYGRALEILEDPTHPDHGLTKTINSNPDCRIVKIKYRASGVKNKSRQRFEPIGTKVVGLFGLNTIEPHHEELIITEGEYDAMIAH